jgi:tRNA(Phe) wybutosine-synthesizing methylase Tyw3
MKMIEFDFNKEDNLDEALEKMFEELKKSLVEKLPKDKLRVKLEKAKLMSEADELSEKLKEVTRNSYVEVGKYINEYLAEDNKAMKKLYEKIKKYLDDNDLPYEEDDKEEDDD